MAPGASIRMSIELPAHVCDMANPNVPSDTEDESYDIASSDGGGCGLVRGGVAVDVDVVAVVVVVVAVDVLQPQLNPVLGVPGFTCAVVQWSSPGRRVPGLPCMATAVCYVVVT